MSLFYRGQIDVDFPFFKRFFGDSFGNLGKPKERVQNALGSGVIVDGEGLVVTNHHVIQGADEITVVLADRREFPAELVVSDERSDLSVLRINAKGEALPTLQFKDSDEAEVGDLVLAIGNPFGVGQTVTMGIVSANEDATMSSKPLESGPNIRLDIFDQMTQVDWPVGVGQSRCDQDLACCHIDESLRNMKFVLQGR